MTYDIQRISDASAWEPRTLEQDDRWKYKLTEHDIREINIALAKILKLNVDEEKINPDTFVLPLLSAKLSEFGDSIENDLGIIVIKGLPVESYSKEELKTIFLGIGSHFGYQLPQSLGGELLQEVFNRGENLYANTGRGTNTSDKLPWHTDRSDVVSLLCVNRSEVGGESKLASLTNVYNKIKEERPDLAEALCADFYHGRAPFESKDLSPWYKLPIFTEYEGKFASRYLRRFVELGQEYPEVPRFSDKQIEALDYLDKRLDDEDVCFYLPFEVGDIQIINNFTICHSRNTYTDSPEKTRFLMRLWLASYKGRALAPEFQSLYGTTEGGVIRGGILL